MHGSADSTSAAPVLTFEAQRARVKGWEDLQTYKDRRPKWIKLHRDLLDDFTFWRLPVESKALLPMLWILASEFHPVEEADLFGTVSLDIEELAFRLRMPVSDVLVAVEPLVAGGWLVPVAEAAPEAGEAPESLRPDLEQAGTDPHESVRIRSSEAESEKRQRKTQTRERAGSMIEEDFPDLVAEIPDLEERWSRRIETAGRSRITPEAERYQLEQVRKWIPDHGVDAVLEAIEKATAGGWRTLVELSRPSGGVVRRFPTFGYEVPDLEAQERRDAEARERLVEMGLLPGPDAAVGGA